MAPSCQPVNKLSGGNVCRLLNFFFLKAGFKVRLFARVGDHRPRLRLHCLRLRLNVDRITGWHRINIQVQLQIHVIRDAPMESMAGSQFRDCTEVTSFGRWGLSQ